MEYNRGHEIRYVATIKNDTDSTKKQTSHFFGSNNNIITTHFFFHFSRHICTASWSE